MSDERVAALERSLQTERNHLLFITGELHWDDTVPKVRASKERISDREALVERAIAQNSAQTE